MSKVLKKYIVRRSYGDYRKGDIISPTGMFRSDLLDNGYIQELPADDSPSPVEDSAQEVLPDESQAEVAPVKRGRGRPKKEIAVA